MHVESLAAILLAMAGGVGVLSMAFLAERSWGVEERTLWNIPYYYLHEDRMAFPAYGYWYRSSYGSLFVHPPVHYFLVGGLMKLGLPLYYAEAAPLTLLTLACVAMILAGGFRVEVQLGLLAGLFSGIGWIEATGGGDYSFHLRPDAHMAMASASSPPIFTTSCPGIEEVANSRTYCRPATTGIHGEVTTAEVPARGDQLSV